MANILKNIKHNLNNFTTTPLLTHSKHNSEENYATN